MAFRRTLYHGGIAARGVVLHLENKSGRVLRIAKQGNRE